MTTTNEEIRQRYEDGKLLNDDADATIRSVNREVNAAAFDGAGLASKVENALTWLSNNTSGGQGIVRVTPKADGTDWSWDGDISIDVTAVDGVWIDVDDNVRIDYPGAGWPITVEGGALTRKRFGLTGGRWFSTGASPSGWLRVRDSFQPVICPNVVDLTSGDSTARAIQIENVDIWSEEVMIGGAPRPTNIFAGVGVETRPASDTGGTGTASFGGLGLQNVHIQTTNEGVHLDGSVAYANLSHPKIFVDADNATGVVLDAEDMRGTVITGMKIEDSNDNQTGTVGIETTANFDGGDGPLMIGTRYVGIDTNWNPNDSFADSFPSLRFTGNAFRVQEPDHAGGYAFIPRDGFTGFPSGRKNFNGSPLEGVDRVESTPVDVRSISTPSQGYEAYHDGSGANTEGPAFYDGSGWTSLVDNTTIS